MAEILRRQVDDEPELAPESSDFLHGLLMNMRLNVELEPSGDPLTDALQARVLRGVADLLQDIQARTRRTMA